MKAISEIPYEPDLRNSIHALPVAEVYRVLASGPNGLRSDEVVERRKRCGYNIIREGRVKPLYIKFIGNFTHLMAILLWVGGIIAFVARLPQLGWAIWAVIVINAVFSFWQEYKAEKALAVLRSLLPVSVVVLRDGQEQKIPAAELVPGDVMLVAEGDHVSADGRLVQEAELRIDQSALSGESHPISKTAEIVPLAGMARAELSNLVFAGSSVASGNGRAVVFATGMETEFGKIAALTLSIEEELSPLQKEINRMTRVVTALAVGIGVVFFFLSVVVVQRPLSSGFLFALGMVVAFVPEGLLPTVTLALAMGVQRMARRNALIKKLSSVETLGSCTVICTDKTGTLTQNEMTVRDIWVAGRSVSVSGCGYSPEGRFVEAGKVVPCEDAGELRTLLVAAALCNDSRIIPPDETVSSWTVLGDPTEAALKVAALKAGIDPEQEAVRLPRLRDIPFDSSRKRMSTIHQDAGYEGAGWHHEFCRSDLQPGLIAFVKGAPKEILMISGSIRIAGSDRLLTDDVRGEIMRVNDDYARNGLRVLAVACRPLPPGHSGYAAEKVEHDLVFLGLMAMMDPPRPEVAAAVDMCRRAGIRIVMITGDYGLTAESIAHRVGIVRSGRPKLISGAELDTMDDTALRTALADEVIFARVAPEHKLRVVSTLQELGNVVAVTGDGVNDAPALRKADIGVAMGISGTDVAKESADMILADDNFASIVNAIEEGRGVYANIKKFVAYIFTSNMPEAWPFIFQIMLNIPLALPIMQILAIDLGTDIVPALALGTERPEPDIMDKPPRSRGERLIDLPLLLRTMVWLGSVQTALCFSGFFYLYWYYGYYDFLHLPRPDLLPYAERLLSPDGTVYVMATTIFLASVVTTQIGNAYACRTERTSVFTIGFFSNRFLLVGIVVEVVLVSLLMYVPPLRRIFELAPLPLHFWVIIFAFPPVLFLAEELRKAFLRRTQRRKTFTGGTP
jgi:potassium/sodium efflux P-type ATPase